MLEYAIYNPNRSGDVCKLQSLRHIASTTLLTVTGMQSRLITNKKNLHSSNCYVAKKHKPLKN